MPNERAVVLLSLTLQLLLLDLVLVVPDRPSAFDEVFNAVEIDFVLSQLGQLAWQVFGHDRLVRGCAKLFTAIVS